MKNWIKHSSLAVSIALIAVICEGCSSQYRLLKKTEGDETFEAKKGFFSGIHYITIDKSTHKKIVFKMIYECESPMVEQEMILTKYDEENNTWLAVTDTSSVLSFFGNPIRKDILLKPVIFQSFTVKEKSLLWEAIKQSEQPLCSDTRNQLIRLSVS